MTSQIFIKEGPPISLLFTLLQNTCHLKTDKYFVITHASFKKGVLSKCIQLFYDELKQYYQKSKAFYLTRKNTYKNFLTVIRQLCNYHNIMYSNDIKYDKSSYEIVYKVFLCDSLVHKQK